MEEKRGKRLAKTTGGPGVFEEADYYAVPEGFRVYSWCPNPDPTKGKATQVHVHFGQPPGTVMVVRLKSPEAVDALIDALREHREDVWGKP